MSQYQEILYQVKDGIATITLNRPDQLNAITGRMHSELRDAMATAADDSAVKVIVWTGAGRGFCAGADIGRLAARTSGDTAAVQQDAQDRFAPKPLQQNAALEFDGVNTYFPTAVTPGHTDDGRNPWYAA